MCKVYGREEKKLRKFIESPKSPTFSPLHFSLYQSETIQHSISLSNSLRAVTEKKVWKKNTERKPCHYPPMMSFARFSFSQQNKVVLRDDRRRSERGILFFLLFLSAPSTLSSYYGFPTTFSTQHRSNLLAPLSECRLHIYIFLCE